MKNIIAIHGGAGNISKSLMTEEEKKERFSVLEESLRAGKLILDADGPAIDAVEAAVCVLEDSPLFNAGKGAVFTNEGKNELDASIMCGKTREAGAVAGVIDVKNPIKLAKTILYKSPHVLLIGAGASFFAKEHHLEMVDPSYFFTQARYDQLLKAKEQEAITLDHSQPNKGTVGAVALDNHGNLAAATSTGGMTNKRWGRVGDSPIIGAGNYADEHVACSMTGTGEAFIRIVAGHELTSLIKYKRLPLKEAVEELIAQLTKIGGEGGVIAIDAKGNYCFQMNSSGMWRGVLEENSPPKIMAFADEIQ